MADFSRRKMQTLCQLPSQKKSEVRSLLLNLWINLLEGAFAVWEHQEIISVLGDTPATQIFCEFYGVVPGGNVPARHDPHGELSGKVHLFPLVRFVQSQHTEHLDPKTFHH